MPLIYKCWVISKRGSASDASFPVEYRQAAQRRRRRRTVPFGVWGVFEVIRMNIICTMIKNTFQKINLEKTEG